MTTNSTIPNARISREDIEGKLRAFQGDIQGKLGEKKNTMLAVGSAVGAVLIVVVFLLGRRSGKKRTTYVDVRRF